MTAGGAVAPSPLPVLVAGIPFELQVPRRWVVWRYKLRDGKWTKLPFIATEAKQPASATDAATWCSFGEALANYQQGTCDGIGFVLGDGWVGFDADGTDAPEHVALLNTYTERSPGGAGIHAIARGTKPGTKCRVGPYELYDSGRYFTITGHHVAGPPTVEERTAEIAALYSRLFPNGNDPANAANTPDVDDDTLITRAKSSKNGAKFSALWAGDCTGYRSHSEADAALCAMLAHLTNGDAPRIDALFRRSGLMRSKWDTRRGDSTWGAQVVARAIAFVQAPPDEEHCVVMRGGELSRIVDRAEAALLTGTAIYQRGGILTRPITLNRALGDATKGEVRREAGSTVLIAVNQPWLVEQMGRVLRWYTVTQAGDKVPADPRSIYARTLLNRGEWRFPVLRGVLTAPTLGRDGRVIEAPGFDEESGLLLDIPSNMFPPVPVSPTQDEARAALARLLDPLRGFPFVDDAARSVALAALLTALIRMSLRTAPLHAYDAPTAGTGKSLLAEMVGLLSTGVRPPALSQGKTPEEDEKRLSTVLFAGDPVIHIDNCERAISGDFLCSMLSQEVVQARILGFSERRVLPSTALVLATGNNLTLAGDVCRRVVICRLDAKVERPDTRTFDFDCHAEVLAKRPELVVAGLTVLRAYAVAGRPQQLPAMGSFDDWAWVRGALVWLDQPDPAKTRESILDADPLKDDLVGVMDLWQRAFGTRGVTVAEIVRPNKQRSTDEALALSELQTRLADVACRGPWNAKSVGWWLRRNKDRLVSGRAFRSKVVHQQQEWSLVAVGTNTDAAKGGYGVLGGFSPPIAEDEDVGF